MTGELLGKRVEWTSQGGGNVSTKRGEVIADLPERSVFGRRVDDLPEEVQKAPRRSLQFRPAEGWRSGIIVRVLPISDLPAGPGNQPLYYSPRRSTLKVVS